MNSNSNDLYSSTDGRAGASTVRKEEEKGAGFFSSLWNNNSLKTSASADTVHIIDEDSSEASTDGDNIKEIAVQGNHRRRKVSAGERDHVTSPPSTPSPIPSSNQKDDSAEVVPEAILSSVFSSMTAAEREEALYDVHAVADDEPISEERLAKAKFDLEEELFRIGHASEAYLAAVDQNDAYVQSLYLGFLLRDRFDVPKAARRLLAHFDFKDKLWGRHTLGRDVTQSDMDEDDLKALEKGFYQYLPRRDTAGRVIFTKIWKYVAFEKEKCVWRVLWYGRMSLCLDEETQRKGFVTLIYNVNDNNWIEAANVKLVSGVAKTLNVLPTKESAFHICYNDKRFGVAMAVPGRVMEKAFSARGRFHYGSHVEIRYDLLSYGIPIGALPFDENGDMKRKDKDNYMAFLRMLRTQEELKKNGRWDPNQPTIIFPSNHDVLLGRGKPVREHPGNVRLGYLVEEKLEEYFGGTRKQKIEIAAQIREAMKKDGTRFLRQDERGIYVVVDETAAMDKIEHFFRNRKGSIPSKSKNASHLQGKNKRAIMIA